MTSTPENDPDIVQAAQIGADAARTSHGSYDTADFERGGYEAAAWDAGPDYLPYRATPAPRRRSWLALLAVAALIFLLVVTVMGLWRTFASRSTTMQVGSCITTSRQGEQWTTERVECSDRERVTYTIVSRIDGEGTCAKPYTSFAYLEQNGSSVRRTYCLMENLTKDACYVSDTDDHQMLQTDCAGGLATARVVNRIDGVADSSKCTQGATPVTFDQTPQRTYCLAKP